MSDMITARQVHQIITDAGFTLNPYAATYVGALQRAEDEYGEEGVKVQILYICNNLRAKGEAQKEVKKKLMKMAK
jgi:hypothetical protein